MQVFWIYVIKTIWFVHFEQFYDFCNFLLIKGPSERELMTEEDNWKRLRDHMDANRLPCIPYLGLFLTDLTFVYEVPGKRGQVDSICNTNRLLSELNI